MEDGREPNLAFDEWIADIDIASSESGENGMASPWFYKEGIKYKSAQLAHLRTSRRDVEEWEDPAECGAEAGWQLLK